MAEKTTKKTSQAKSPKKTVESKISKTKSEAMEVWNTPEKTTSKRGMYLFLVIAVLLAGLFLASRYLIVAWVDNKPITRFEYFSGLDKRYGKDFREELIVEKLLLSESAKRKIVITPGEIDTEMKKVEDQQGGADKLNQILSVQNISRDDFKKLIQFQIIKQKMFANDATVSAEEVDKYIEDNKQSLVSGDSQIDDKLKQSVSDQLKQQKTNDNFNKWLTDALKSARVKRS